MPAAGCSAAVAVQHPPEDDHRLCGVDVLVPTRREVSAKRCKHC